MFRLLLTVTLLAIAEGALQRNTPQRLGGKIVGGEDANIEDYPYQVAVEYQNRFHCGGSIITPNKVLTAAHCTHGYNPKRFRIRAGTSLQGKDGQVIKVTEVCPHPEYDSFIFDKDVSVLTLAEDIEYGPSAQPSNLALAGSEELREGTVASVSGWGGLWGGGPTSKQLQVVEVPLISKEQCKDFYEPNNPVTDNMLCFGFENGGKDACQGDSGGPIVADGVQVGVVSWGIGCAKPRKPGVYAKVAVLRGHIDRC